MTTALVWLRADLADRASEAISEGSRTWRRALLSRRRNHDENTADSGQTSLDGFGGD